MALGRVYCFGPTFRAEKSKTRRHLTEFWMVEPEMAYADLDDVMALAEGLLVDIVGRVLDKRRHELKVLERDVTKLERVQGPFPRISYDEAVTILQEKGLPFEWGGDFGGPDETALYEHFDRPVMVHRYPAAIRRSHEAGPQRPELALGSTCWRRRVTARSSAAASIDDLDLLLKRIGEHQLPKEAFDWYRSRRCGAHGGFGMASSAPSPGSAASGVRETIPIRGCYGFIVIAELVSWCW
jgi:asparaginyl-tRNA synthetase